MENIYWKKITLFLDLMMMASWVLYAILYGALYIVLPKYIFLKIQINYIVGIFTFLQITLVKILARY